MLIIISIFSFPSLKIHHLSLFLMNSYAAVLFTSFNLAFIKFCLISKVRQATSHLSSIEKQLNDRTSESGLHEAKFRELQEELESRTRRVGELEGSLETKDIELKESAALVDRVKALHSEQCNELQRQIEEVSKRTNNGTSKLCGVRVLDHGYFSLAPEEIHKEDT